MGYKYRKKKYYKKYNKPDPIIGGAIILIVLFYQLDAIYKAYPVLSIVIVILIIIATLISIHFYFKSKKNKNNKYLNIRSINDMKRLEWREFEKFIEFVFNKNGFKATVRAGRNDGGIDLDATFKGETYVIQCKKWTNYSVKVGIIREFYGVMMATGVNTKGIFITTTRLTNEADKFANDNGIEIWDSSNLEGFIEEFMGGSDELEVKTDIKENQKKEIVIENKLGNNSVCEKCGGQMVLRKAKRGDHKGEGFYGCSNFPKCRNIIK